MSAFRSAAFGALALACIASSSPVAARYLESDPIGLAAGPSTYGYVQNAPLQNADPLGLDTTIVVNANSSWRYPWTWSGKHIGLHLDSGQFKEPLIYDPNGSYDPQGMRGSGGVISDEWAGLADYIAFQQTDGPDVYTITFKTTPEEEALIGKRIEMQGESRSFSCASNVSDALNGIGPFKNLGSHNKPNDLADALKRIKRSQALWKSYKHP